MEIWRRARVIAEEALERDPGDREAWVIQECGIDTLLRDAALEFVRGSDPADGFLEPPVGVDAFDASRDDEVEGEGDRVGAYRLVERLAAGGMGTVYRAQRADAVFDKDVAIKVMKRGLSSATAVQRFERERQLLARLEHPSITRLIDGGTTESGRPYIVMELVDGDPITSYCRNRALPVHRRIELLRDVCLAVHHAHCSLVVHCDVKPSNVLVSGSGTVKLLDFGIARLLDASSVEDPATPISPRYASPEQFRGEGLTTASDVYSLGVLIREVLRGADTTGCADELQAVIDRASASEPSQRYPSSAALAEDLTRFLEGRPVQAFSGGVLYRLAKTGARHPVAVTGGFIAIVVMAGLTIQNAVAHARLAVEHRSLQRAQVAESEATRAARRGARFWEGLLEGVDPLHTARPSWELPELLDEASVRAEQLPADSIVAGRVHATLAKAMLGVGRVAEAEQHVRTAIQAFECWPDLVSELVAALELSAEVCRWRMDLAGAGLELQRAFGLVRERDLPDVSLRVQLARSYFEHGFADQAELCYRSALTSQDPEANDWRPVVASELASLILLDGREDEAVALVDQAERELAARPEASVDRRAATLGAVASALDALGSCEQARTRWGRCLALLEEAHGVSHPQTITPRIALAMTVESLGEFGEAERQLRRAVSDAERALPEWHETLAMARGRLGFFLWTHDRPGEAIPWLELAHGRQIGVAGPDHPVVQQLAQAIAAARQEDQSLR